MGDVATEQNETHDMKSAAQETRSGFIPSQDTLC